MYINMPHMNERAGSAMWTLNHLMLINISVNIQDRYKHQGHIYGVLCEHLN